MKDTTPNLYSKRIYLTSLLIAMAFMFNSICLLANILMPSLSDFGEIFIVIILVLGILVCISRTTRMNVNVLFISLSILVVIMASYIVYNFSEITGILLINYIAWGVAIPLIMMQAYNVKKVINISFWIALITILFELFTHAELTYEPMTWTYSVFPCISVMIIHFAYCRFSKFYLQLAYIPGAIMLFKYIIFANRGGWVSLVVLLFFVSIKSIKNTDRNLKTKKSISIIFLIITLIIILFSEQIITLIYDLSVSMDLNFDALTKTYMLLQRGDITNNRAEIYKYAWDGFLQSPIWGNGVGAFSIKYGGWTHNFMLQLLYEGGIMLGALILIPFVRNCMFVLKEKHLTADEYALFVMLFTTSVPKLLFSTELWNTQGFWMLFAFSMLIKSKYIISRRGI